MYKKVFPYANKGLGISEDLEAMDASTLETFQVRKPVSPQGI